MKNIEESLGCPVFLRANSGIVLTPEGELYYEYCRRMLRETEELKQSMGAMTGEVRGTLKIASSINFADYELPGLLRGFMKAYPDVRIELKTGYSHEVSKLFNSGDCMVALVRGDYKCVGYTVPLLQEPYCLVYKDEIDVTELCSIPFIRYRTDHSVSVIIDNWCTEHLPELPKSIMELDSMVTCRHFIQHGLGWSILPYMGLGSSQEKGLHIMPIKDRAHRNIVRGTSLVYDELNGKLAAVQAFVAYVRKYYKERPGALI